MAYVDIPALKRSIVDQLAAEVLPDGFDGKPIPVDYAWPGIDNQKPVHVWMFNAAVTSEPRAQMSGRKRRDQTVELTIVFEAVKQGATVDRSGRNVLQEIVDAKIAEIAGSIDEWLADNPTAGQTSSSDVPVDWARFDGWTLEQGVLDGGASARGTVRISIRTFPK